MNKKKLKTHPIFFTWWRWPKSFFFAPKKRVKNPPTVWNQAVSNQSQLQFRLRSSQNQCCRGFGGTHPETAKNFPPRKTDRQHLSWKLQKFEVSCVCWGTFDIPDAFQKRVRLWYDMCHNHVPRTLHTRFLAHPKKCHILLAEICHSFPFQAGKPKTKELTQAMKQQGRSWVLWSYTYKPILCETAMFSPRSFLNSKLGTPNWKKIPQPKTGKKNPPKNRVSHK